jgi:UDP-N-acetylglucosamine 4,6-dehydratase
MKTVLITGGSGTIGKAFIREYYNEFQFVSFARNEKAQVQLKRNFPNTEIVLGSIENEITLEIAFIKYKPTIVIHAAALKHVDTAEKQPSAAVGANILGSLNVIRLSRKYGVDYCIGISTDKACSPGNLYGQTKYIMERLFQEFDDPLGTRFINCRFGNVAWSNGSVLPYWSRLNEEGKSLPVTDTRMTRLIFSDKEAAQLIRKSIDLCVEIDSFFILSKKMKKVSMIKLAKLISDNYHIIGLRDGEILFEELINEKEKDYCYIIDDVYLALIPEKIEYYAKKFNCSLSSENAEEMSTEEMELLLLNFKEGRDFNYKTNY